MKKEEFSKLFAPMVASLIGYVGSVAFLSGFYVTKDQNLIILAFLTLAAAPVPILVMMWELIDGGEQSTRIVPYLSKKKDLT